MQGQAAFATRHACVGGQLGAIVGADAERYTVQLPHETVRLRFGAVAAC